MALRETAIVENRVASQLDPGDASKPLMSNGSILMMSLGFGGISFAFGLQQSAINPLFSIIGANPEELPILNLAGPVTGLLVQPIVGVLSDRTWTRWGRRRPFFVPGIILAALALFLFPFVAALWMAVALLWILDTGANAAMEPYRTLVSDKLRLSQRSTGYLLQGVMIAVGAVLANVSLFAFQALIEGANDVGVPYWVPAVFWAGTVCLLLSVAVSSKQTKELEPSDEEIARIRTMPRNPLAVFAEVFHAVREMPPNMHKLGIVYAFQWYALFVWWQYGALIIGQTAFGVDTRSPDFNKTAEFQSAVGWTGLVNGWYMLVALGASLVMIPLAKRFGVKNVHAVALVIAGIGLGVLPFMGDKYMLLIPAAGLGIAMASVNSMPFVIVTSIVPAARFGVYLGILNMMIVVPQLVETLSFGWIFPNILASDPLKACVFAGVMFALAGLAAIWIKSPKLSEESPLIPLGAS